MNKQPAQRGKEKGPRFCPACGAPLAPGAAFCPACGQRTGKKPSQTAGKKKRPWGWLAAGGAAAALVLVLALILLLGGGGREFRSSGELWGSLSGEEHILFDRERGLAYYDNELVVYAAPGAEEEIAALAGGMGASIAGADGYANCYLLRFASAQSPEELELALLAFEGHPAVQSAGYNLALELELNYEPVTDLWPQSEWSETPGGSNWNMEAIRAPAAWEYREAFQPVRVGVFDGGCLTSHEDLKNVVGASCLAETEQSRISHGTHVAGIIAAEWNETGVSGLCPSATLAVVDCDAAGQGLSTSSFLYGTAFSYLIGEQHCRVVNVSLGFNEELSYAASHGVMFAQLQAQAMGAQLADRLSRLLQTAQAEGRDFVICAAAGNGNNSNFFESSDAPYGYYAQCTAHDHPQNNYYVDENGDCHKLPWYVLQWEHEGVDAEWASPLTVIDDFEIKSRIVVVGACELTQSRDLAQTDYSNTGARVDLLAPGGGASSPITSALAGGTPYGPMTGTSMASPHAAGAAALALAIDPNLTGPEVKELLRRASQTEAQGAEVRVLDAGGVVELAVENAFITVSGQTVNGLTNEPISVPVEVYKDGALFDTIQSGQDGVFTFTAPLAEYTLRFARKGYLIEEYFEEYELTVPEMEPGSALTFGEPVRYYPQGESAATPAPSGPEYDGLLMLSALPYTAHAAEASVVEYELTGHVYSYNDSYGIRTDLPDFGTIFDQTADFGKTGYPTRVTVQPHAWEWEGTSVPEDPVLAIMLETSNPGRASRSIYGQRYPSLMAASESRAILVEAPATDYLVIESVSNSNTFIKDGVYHFAESPLSYEEKLLVYDMNDWSSWTYSLTRDYETGYVRITENIHTPDGVGSAEGFLYREGVTPSSAPYGSLQEALNHIRAALPAELAGLIRGGTEAEGASAATTLYLARVEQDPQDFPLEEAGERVLTGRLYLGN